MACCRIGRGTHSYGLDLCLLFCCNLQDIKTGGIPHDQWLFERIAAAATAAAADGGVWRSGGKYILSAVSRNQSPVALGRYLVTIGQSQCAAQTTNTHSCR